MRSESNLVYIEASIDGQIEKVLGDWGWLPFTLKPYESNLYDLLPVLVGVPANSRLDFDFIELGRGIYADIQFQSEFGRTFVWIRNSSRHAAHVRAAQQSANSSALREAISERWLDDIQRERSHVRVLFEQVPLPVGYWDINGTLRFCNAAFATITGMSAPKLEGLQSTDPHLGMMQVPATLFKQLLQEKYLTYVRRTPNANTANVAHSANAAYTSRLSADIAPTGEIAGYLDVSVPL